MNKLKSHIRKICRNMIEKKGWRPFKDINVEVVPTMDLSGAHIALAGRKINIIIGEDLYEAVDSLKKDEKIEKDQDLLIREGIEHLVSHEYGHHQHCPKTREDLQEILAGNFEAIHKREYREETIKGLCFYIFNMFSDTIVNTINSHNGSDKQAYRDSHSLFYLLMNNYQRRKDKGFFKGRSDKAFTLFKSSNQFLCQTDPEMNEKMKKYLARFFLGFERYRNKVIDVFTGNKDLTRAVLERNMNEHVVEDLTARLKDNSLWKQMSYDYSSIVYPFLRQQLDWLQNSFSRQQESNKRRKYGQGNKKGQGQGNKNKENSEKRNKQEQGGQQAKPTKPTNNKEESDEKGNKPAIAGRGNKNNDYDEYFRRLLSEKTNVPYQSPLVAQLTRLDALYRQRAGKLALFAEDKNRGSLQYEKNLSKEQISSAQFKPKDIDWSSTRIIKRKDNTKHVEIYRGTLPMVLPIEAEEKPGGIPDLSFIFDSSCSMTFSPFEGDGKGEYHYATLAFYSILNYLEKQGLAPLLNFNLINFSNTTFSSGWQSYRNIYEIKETLFNYQGLETFLNPQALTHLRTDRKDNFICFMLSDTDFNYQENTKEVIKEVDDMLRCRGIGFYLFQLRRPTEFSNAMEEREIPVHYIKSSRDFMNKSIKFSKDLYGKVVENAGL